MKRLAVAGSLLALLVLPPAGMATVQNDLTVSQPASEFQMGAGVTIVDFAFQPGAVVVTPGTTVSWFNAGAAPHTVSSPAGGFDSGTLGPGGSYSVTLSTAGSYGYFCAIHPSMTGSVTVAGM
jgi:plastocyanin